MCRDGCGKIVNKASADVGRERWMTERYNFRRWAERWRIAEAVQCGQVHKCSAKFDNGRCISITSGITFFGK